MRIIGGLLRNSLVAYCQTSGNGGGVIQSGGSVKNCTVVYNSASVSNGGVSGMVTDCLTFGNKTNGQVESTDDPGFKDAANYRKESGHRSGGKPRDASYKAVAEIGLPHSVSTAVQLSYVGHSVTRRKR